MSNEGLDQILTADCIKRLHPNPMKCLCAGWVRECPTEAELKGHHKGCPLFKEPAGE